MRIFRVKLLTRWRMEIFYQNLRRFYLIRMQLWEIIVLWIVVVSGSVAIKYI